MTDALDNELLYINEQPLDIDIRKYLVHLAALAKSPIVVGVRGRPQGIAVDIHNALAAQEQRLISRKEEIAADEMTDPHSSASIGAGRRELSNLIADMALPLADNTWANEVRIDLQIGHELPSPCAPSGLAICIIFDCKHGIIRQRFAPQPESVAPETEKDVSLGMTVVVRPEKIGMHHVHDESTRSQGMGLGKEDSALYQWTLYTLLLLANFQEMIEYKIGEEQKLALNQARSTMAAVMFAIRMQRQQEAAISAAAADQQVAPVTMPPIDQVKRALQSVRRVSPRLGVAIQRVETALERLAPAVQAHAASHNQIASLEHEAARQTVREPQPKHSAPHTQRGPAPTPEEH